MGRREEVQPKHVGRPRRDVGDRVHVQIGRVGRHDGARSRELVDPAENGVLHRHVLEGGLDDQIRVSDDAPVVAGMNARQPLGDGGFGQTAALDPRLIKIPHAPGAGRGGIGVLLKQIDGETRIGQADGDAGPHCAGTDYGDPADRPRRCVVRARHRCRQPFRFGQMAERLRLQGVNVVFPRRRN